MIIGIDGNEANVSHKVGVSEFAFQLLHQFYRLRKEGKISDKFYIYLKDHPQSDLPVATDWFSYVIVGPKKLWTQIGLPLHLFLERKKPDIFMSPTHYAPRFSLIPTVVSVMDLSYLHFPELFKKTDLYQLTNWTSYSVKQAKHVITISLSSKNDIIKYYGIEDKKVSVVYLGLKPLMKDTAKISKEVLKEKYTINSNYILFVGTLQPRKNIARLIEAFSLIKDKTLQLVIIGKKGWLYEDIISAPQKFSVADRVKFLDYVTDEDLPAFYTYAECFVLPSLYEGFGLPVLEAMQYGCPVIISNVSSLPEAGGDAAVYVDPHNTSDIVEKIENVLKNKKLRQEMIRKGYEQVKKFSWDKTAKEVLDILKNTV